MARFAPGTDVGWPGLPGAKVRRADRPAAVVTAKTGRKWMINRVIAVPEAANWL